MIQKSSNFGKDFIVYIVGSASQLAISFILLPILTRLFEPAEYGIIDINTTIIQILSLIFGFGLTTAVSFYYYFHENEYEKKVTITTGLIFLLIINTIIFTILFLNSRAISILFFKTPQYSAITKITIVISGLSIFVNYFFHLLRITRKAVLYVINSVIRTVLQIMVILLVVIFLKIGLRGYFYGYLIAVIFSLIIITFFISKYLTFKFSKKHLVELLKYGLPVIPAGISLWVLQLIDRFFLVHYSTLNEVGLYGIGVRATILLVLLTTSMQLAWGPFAFSVMKKPDAKKIYSQVFSLFIIIATWFAVITTYFAKEAITFITTPEYTRAYIVTPFISYGTIFLGAYSLLSIGINIVKKMHLITTTTVIAAILNILLNFILIPPYGMLGAAIATAISYLVSTIIVYIFAQKHYQIDFKMPKNILITLIGICYLAAYFTINIDNTTTNLIIRFLICISYPLLLYILRLLSPDQIKSVLSSIKSLIRTKSPSNNSQI